MLPAPINQIVVAQLLMTLDRVLEYLVDAGRPSLVVLVSLDVVDPVHSRVPEGDQKHFARGFLGDLIISRLSRNIKLIKLEVTRLIF